MVLKTPPDFDNPFIHHNCEHTTCPLSVIYTSKLSLLDRLNEQVGLNYKHSADCFSRL